MCVYLFFQNLVRPFFQKSHRSSIVIFLITLSFIFPTHATAQVISVDPQNVAIGIKKMEAQIQSNLQKGQIPGCAIAVVFRNQVIFISGYGVRTIGKKEKIDIDTIFQLGSVSKPIAATLTSVLEDHGLLNMEDSVIEYLPNFTLNNRLSPCALKIKHLLNHTSGVPRGGFNNLIETHMPPAQLKLALQRPRVGPVGHRYDYHNAMFGLIADVTQAATLQKFPDALKTNLLQPLHMTNTSATYEALMRNRNKASPHTKNNRGMLCVCEPFSKGYYAVAPAGGINSSIRDMATFLKAQMGGYPQVVSSKALARAQTPLISTNNLLNSAPGSATRSRNPSYGLGWRLLDYANQKLVYHGGWLKGFTNFLAFLPNQKLGIIVLHNADTRFSTQLAMNFFETALGLPPANKISALFERHKEKHRKQMYRSKITPKPRTIKKEAAQSKPLKVKHIKPKTKIKRQPLS
jgi:beta-lactamase class C